ncbi:ferredoxin subunit of nitrite reductase and ring-hydroxylating dioxygenase [Saccharomonospora marina XMU15]|uniref:Ferredoxin subunit of nitrite reductase and ring-hydroxylating dioxygenase n=1 Tax=Saccharomonospora marina XMU15 TaxID=882083 RepID=H5X1R9_9PSEU|nr:Rieske 2Fe-2S domain-containing protein [Saccharomonospora marina]EHR50932.1 ferredoxin subunit of nitrite reductase and ring-hydroxylating dioxygenase [Saccharomonospora marina XMU15]
MAEWLHLADLSELARRKKKRVVVAGEQIALFFVDGQVYALHDVCVHRQRSLSKGVVLGGAVVCPGHQWRFDPATGQAHDQPLCQPTFDVRVDGDRVYVNPVRRGRVGAAG